MEAAASSWKWTDPRDDMAKGSPLSETSSRISRMRWELFENSLDVRISTPTGLNFEFHVTMSQLGIWTSRRSRIFVRTFFSDMVGFAGHEPMVDLRNYNRWMSLNMMVNQSRFRFHLLNGWTWAIQQNASQGRFVPQKRACAKVSVAGTIL